MDSDRNSNPAATDTSPEHLYCISPFRSFLRKPADVLDEQIEKHSVQGWRLVTSFDLGASGHYLVWKRDLIHASNGSATSQYRILPHSNFLASLRQRSFSALNRAIANELAKLPAGWTVEAYCPSVGCVLRCHPVSVLEQTGLEEYSIVRRGPVWWRTLFGNSWMRILSGELNSFSRQEFEIVAYMGADCFLARKKHGMDPAGSNVAGSPQTYRLAMWPNWKRVLLPGPPNIVPWFVNEAANGWELVSHHAGAIFLFGKTSEVKRW